MMPQTPPRPAGTECHGESAPLAAPEWPPRRSAQSGEGGTRKKWQCENWLFKHGNTFILQTETSG